MVTIGVIGWNGLVGQQLLKLLSACRVNLVLLGRESYDQTALSNGKPVFAGSSYDFSQLDGVFLSVSPLVAKEYLLRIKTPWVIDNSGALSDQSTVVVPEIHDGNVGRVVTSPNCMAIALSLLLYALQDCGIHSVWGSSYQSISGAGKREMQKMLLKEGVYNNLQPNIPLEAEMIARDTQKILRRSIHIDIFTVRVPIQYGHGMHLRMKLEKQINKLDMVDKLVACPYIEYDEGHNPTPKQVVGSNKIHVGCLRVYKDVVDLWLVSDNVYRGAAWNMYAIAKKYFGVMEKVYE